MDTTHHQFLYSLGRRDRVHHVHINPLGVGVHQYEVVIAVERTSEVEMDPGPCHSQGCSGAGAGEARVSWQTGHELTMFSKSVWIPGHQT